MRLLDLYAPSPARQRRLQRFARPLTILLSLLAAAYFGFLFTRGKYQDWYHLYHGIYAVMHGTDPYQSGMQGYIYPPFFAVVFAPLGLLSQGTSGFVFAIMSGVMMLAALWLIARETCRLLGLGEQSWRVWTIALAGLLFNADKLRAVLYSGQSDHLVMLLLASGFALVRRWPFLAGLCVGLASVVKYQSLIFLPYFVLRRRWHEAMGMLAGFAGGLLVGVPVFGWQTNLSYLARSFRGLASMVGLSVADATPVHPMTWYASVSIASALARITHYPANKPLFIALYIAVAIACLASVAWMYRRVAVDVGLGEPLFVGRYGQAERSLARGTLTALEWSGLIIVAIVFSPQSVGRHFVLAVFPLMLAAALLLHPRSSISGTRVSRTWLVAGLIVYVAGLTLPPGNSIYEPWLKQWKHIGGASWCALFMFFTLVAHALAWGKAHQTSGTIAGTKNQ